MTALAAALLALGGWLPLGIPKEWTWGRIFPPRLGGFLPPCLLTAYLGLIWLGSRWITDARTSIRRGALAAMAIGGFAASMALQNAGYGLEKWPFLLYQPSSSGYYTAAKKIRSVSEFLQRGLPRGSASFPTHVDVHPPGPILLQYGALRTCERCSSLTRVLLALQPEGVRQGFQDLGLDTPLPEADQASIFLVALLTQGALTLSVFPVFALARRWASPEAAWWATALWTLAPAPALFAPGSDVLYPLLGASCLLLALKERPMAAGAVLWTALLLGLSMLALVPLLLLVPFLPAEGGSGRRCTRNLGGLALGLLVPTACLQWLTGHNLFATWTRCLKAGDASNLALGRSYVPWIGGDLIEFLLGMGLPLAFASLAGTRRSRWTAAWAATVLALALTGKTRGEVARLWIFLMPLAVPGVAAAIEACPNLRKTGLLLLAAQAVQALAFTASIQGFIDLGSLGM